MARRAFVFVQLPGAVEPVVAGLFTHEDSLSPALGRFVYGKSYLANTSAVPLDPVALPLREVEFTTTLTEGFFGVLRDALPDDWGRHVIQKLYGERYATSFDYLLLPSADRFGALAFGPRSESPDEDPPLATLDSLSEQVLTAVEKIDRDLALTEAEKRAAIAFGGGTHAGGARPKLTLRDGDGVWLAKLNRFEDPYNVVRVEAAMLDLAEACAIRVPEHRVARIHRKEALLVRRFDRAIVGGAVLKHRAVSAATIFRDDEESARINFTGSYMRLSRELARWGVDVASDRRQLYRRMAFNCLTGVTDDHERNHALVAVGEHFRLAPAFDPTPARPTTRRRFQALAVGASGAEATRTNVLSEVHQFGLTREEAEAIIETVKGTVSAQWRVCFLARGVTDSDTALLARCFDHGYFELG